MRYSTDSGINRISSINEGLKSMLICRFVVSLLMDAKSTVALKSTAVMFSYSLKPTLHFTVTSEGNSLIFVLIPLLFLQSLSDIIQSYADVLFFPKCHSDQLSGIYSGDDWKNNCSLQRGSRLCANARRPEGYPTVARRYPTVISRCTNGELKAWANANNERERRTQTMNYELALISFRSFP